MVDPISLLIAGGAIGYAIARDGKTIVPITGQNLRESKPSFEKKIEIDTSVAHNEATKNWEYPEEGNLIYVVNPTTPIDDVYVRFNEPDAADWKLTELRKIRFPFYRFFITNAAGTGTLEIRVARGLQVEPFEGVVSTVGSVLNAIGDVSVPSPSDEYVLGWDSTAGVWVAYALTDIALFAAHKTRHQDGGDDEISIAGLAGESVNLAAHRLVKSANATLGHVIVETASLIDVDASGKLTLGDHAGTHQDGGTDEISIAALSGEPAELTTHKAIKAANAVLGHVIVETGSDIDVDASGKITLGGHKGRHEDTGNDEINVGGLAGLLAADQHVLDAEVKLIKLDDFATPDDNTDLDATDALHGLLAKLDKAKLDGIAASSTPATKEIFACVFHKATNMDESGALVDGAGDRGVAQLLIPQDFTTLTSIEAIFRTVENAASQHVNITTRWGAYNGGEAYDVHMENDVGRDLGATTAAENLNHDISDLVDVAALVAGDILGVAVGYDATVVDSNVAFRGVRFKYT